MSHDACPLPSSNRSNDPEADAIARMLRGKRIAVVGLSDKRSRTAYRIAEFLRSVGREVVPVNPNYEQVMGLRCYPSVASVPGEVDVVDVFRRAEFCADVVRDAIEANAGGVWLQSGIINDEARRLAEEAGIDYVEDRCLMVEIMHAR
ncbi:MAG: CoA-binding protein [Anaerolineae bacterium]|nr:CoA-binding protein [Phycisphaerae bacterium]